jgi:Fe-S cluster assembly scaffold protein SufB
MKRAILLLCLLALTTALPITNVYADSVSCSGGIISTGDRSTDVLAKCGSPDSKDSHVEAVTQRIDADTKQTVYITVEEWTYNFGTNQFLRTIVLKNGVVAEIRTGNYGYSKP